MKTKKIIAGITAIICSFGVASYMPVISTDAAGNLFFQNGFESSTDDWKERGSATIATSSKNAYEGKSSLFVQSRAESWNGAYKSLDSTTFIPGNAYSFSANVSYLSGGTTDTFFMKLQYNDANGDPQYPTIAEANALKGEWVQLANTNYTIPSDATDIQLYIETAETTYDFYIDEVIAAESGTEISGAGEGRKMILGDINGDESVDVIDTIYARKGIINGFSSYIAETCADVDQSGTFDSADLVLIHQFVSIRINEFPVAEKPKPSFNYNANLQYKAAPDKYINEPASQQGTIVKETYNGINGQKSLHVYLPYGYDESQKYNIFYIMHGGGENENTIFFDKDAKLGNILDHMIQNGELEPMIVVTPTFNGGNCTAQNFYNEFRQSVVPFVEGKYSTYAESTSAEDIAASRMHRAYGGFSMGSVSTWAVMENCLDIVGYFMPLSGDHWSGNSGTEKAMSIANAVDRSGLSQREFFILAATGSDDIAYPNVTPQIEAMKTMSQFKYTSDFSQGNFYYMVAPGLTHWWGYVRHYVYDALPYFFHE